MKWIILLILCPSLVQAAKGRKLISQSVGQVKEHVVTSREVQINQLVEKALYRPQKKKTKMEILTMGSREFLREVTAVLLEWTVHYEAESFAAAQVSSSDLVRAERTVLRRATKIKGWVDLGVREVELKALIRRKLQAKKFIRFKVDSASVPVTDAEAKEYFENNRLQFGTLPFDNFKSNIKAYLRRQQVDQRLKDWFEVLQGKYRVRNFLVDI